MKNKTLKCEKCGKSYEIRLDSHYYVICRTCRLEKLEEKKKNRPWWAGFTDAYYKLD